MNAVPLSPVDYVFTGVGSQPITFAFAYPNKLDVDKLRTSLRETLNHFPILQSQLKQVSATDYEFQVGENGLTFDVVESNLIFADAGRIEQYITPVNSVAGEPLTKITVTQTPNGSVLAVSISHALVDGYSYFHFLSSWARICRGDRIVAPYLPRDFFASYLKHKTTTVSAEDVYNDCGLFYGGRRHQLQTGAIHAEHFFISAESIKSNMEEAKHEHNVSFTENDVITAHLWKKYIPMWNKEDENPKTYITCPFDFRRVLTGFPKNYFGCALCFATAAIDLHDLSHASIGDLAVLVRNSVGKIKDDFILNSFNTLENLRQQNGLTAMEKIHLRHPKHGIIVTNLSRLPIRDIDFGLGAPADFLVYAEVLGSAAILPAEKGVEVLVVPPLK